MLNHTENNKIHINDNDEEEEDTRMTDQVKPTNSVEQEVSTEKQQNEGGCCSAGCLRRRWKQLLIVLILAGVISWVIVDAVTKNCMMTESEGARVQRLFCDDYIEADEDGNVITGQTFTCTGTNETVSEDGWYIDDSTSPPTCVKESACLAVGFQTMLDFIAENVGLGWLIMAGIYALLTVMLIPGSVLTIGSGVAFGTALGLGKGLLVGASAVIVGATIGSVLAFLMGRYLLKEHIEAWSNRFPIIKALDKALETQGFKITLLLRLSPIVPFNVFNFIMGSTSCSLSGYFYGTIIGIIPGTTAFVFIGAIVGSAAFDASMSPSDGSLVMEDQCEPDPKEATIRLALAVGGGIATIIAVCLLVRFARKEFQKIKEESHINDQGEIEEEETTTLTA